MATDVSGIDCPYAAQSSHCTDLDLLLLPSRYQGLHVTPTKDHVHANWYSPLSPTLCMGENLRPRVFHVPIHPCQKTSHDENASRPMDANSWLVSNT
jgi:hypothetical protein